MCTTWYFLVWNSELLGKSWLPPISDMLTGSSLWLPCEQCGCCRLRPCADIKASDSVLVLALKSHTFPKAPSSRNDSAILTSPRYDVSNHVFTCSLDRARLNSLVFFLTHAGFDRGIGAYTWNILPLSWRLLALELGALGWRPEVRYFRSFVENEARLLLFYDSISSPRALLW